MLFSAQMSLRNRAALCRRLATALTAGIDIRKILAREAIARNSAARRRLRIVSEAVAQGETLTAALAETKDYFPPLFHEMVAVGEQTGHLGEIFAQLAEHYDNQIVLRRNFRASIAWPMFQLLIALSVVGFLIWFGGVIGRMGGNNPIDFLGLGLVGDRGLLIYLAIVAAAAAVVWFLIRAATRGLIWARPIQRAVLRVPVLGPALQVLGLSRLAWSMHLTMNAGMEIRKALRLSLRNAGSALYSDAADKIHATIADGNSIYEAFYEAGCFPPDFLDSVQVGEESGRLVESMDHLSRQYQDQARAALATLTTVAGICIWALVAIMIICLIFRLFFFYFGVLNDALKG